MEEHVSIVTPDHIELDFEPAGIGSRLLALSIDAGLIFVLFVLLLISAILGGVLSARLGGEDSGAIFLAGVIFLFYLLIWGYFVLFEGIWKGQTPGKRGAGIRVVQDNGLPIGWREAALRNLVRAADIMPPPACLVGGLMILFSRRGKRLGDMLAGTMVVRERSAGAAHPRASRWETVWVAGAEQGKTRRSITFGNVRVEAQQIQIIEKYLSRSHALPPLQRRDLSWRLALPFLDSAGQRAESLVGAPERVEACEDILRRISQQAAAVSQAAALELEDAAEAKRKQWREFESRINGLQSLGKSGLRQLGAESLVGLLDGYHRIAGDLARARAIGRDSALVRQLNNVAIRAHNILYGHIKPPRAGDSTYWGYRFPIAVRGHLAAMAVSAALMFLPGFVSYAAVQLHPDLGYDMVPEAFLNFEPAREESLHSFPAITRPIVASTIIGNNIQVTLLSFGLGLTAGIGTAFLLVVNGVQIGAIGGWLTARGTGRSFWGWVMPHGGTELLAVVLAGGAGLILAGALIAPGQMRRAAALRKVAMDALTIELGVMVMLAFAGLIEGFVSPSALSYSGRIAVLAVTLAFWFTYLAFAGRGAGRSQSKE